VHKPEDTGGAKADGKKSRGSEREEHHGRNHAHAIREPEDRDVDSTGTTSNRRVGPQRFFGSSGRAQQPIE
jgi:hypothetical protein